MTRRFGGDFQGMSSLAHAGLAGGMEGFTASPGLSTNFGFGSAWVATATVHAWHTFAGIWYAGLRCRIGLCSATDGGLHCANLSFRVLMRQCSPT
jgi:hypothetical protein